MTHTPLPPREDLNISPKTAELLALIDNVEDGDTLAKALEAAVLALVDVAGKDPQRPTINRPGKLADRTLTRIIETLEEGADFS